MSHRGNHEIELIHVWEAKPPEEKTKRHQAVLRPCLRGCAVKFRKFNEWHLGLSFYQSMRNKMIARNLFVFSVCTSFRTLAFLHWIRSQQLWSTVNHSRNKTRAKKNRKRRTTAERDEFLMRVDLLQFLFVTATAISCSMLVVSPSTNSSGYFKSFAIWI